MGQFDTIIALNNGLDSWLQFLLLFVPMMFTSVLCSCTYLFLVGTHVPLTIPYNLSLSVWLSFAASTSAFSPIFVSTVAPSVRLDVISANAFISWVFAGVGQVYFSPNFASSLLIFLALFIGSPLAALLGIFGSLIGTFVAVCANSLLATTQIGLDGLSSTLTSIAIGGFFFIFSKSSVCMAILGSIFCVPARYLFSGWLVRPGGPAMTLPFCAVATVLLRASVFSRRPAQLDSVERNLMQPIPQASTCADTMLLQ